MYKALAKLQICSESGVEEVELAKRAFPVEWKLLKRDTLANYLAIDTKKGRVATLAASSAQART